MKLAACIAAALIALPGLAEAKTAVAICTDGQKLQFNQALGGPGTLYLKTAGGTYEIATLDSAAQPSLVEICGAEAGQGGANASIQLCINSKGAIFMREQKGAQIVRTAVCAADVKMH